MIQWKFENPERMKKAVKVCEENLAEGSWFIVDKETIEFATMEDEERFSIARHISSYSRKLYPLG